MKFKINAVWCYGEYLRLPEGCDNIADIFDLKGEKLYTFLLLNNRAAFEELLEKGPSPQRLFEAFKLPDWVIGEMTGTSGTELKLILQVLEKTAIAPMSYGSRGMPSFQLDALSQRLGMPANTGEGSQDKEFAKSFPSYSKYKSVDELLALTKSDPDEFHSLSQGLFHMFGIQIASGLFGLTVQTVAEATSFMLKMIQGAKPGEGGHLDGKKVSGKIADARFVTPGITLISPSNKDGINSIEELTAEFLAFMMANPGMQASIKLGALANGVDTVSGVIDAYTSARFEMEAFLRDAHEQGLLLDVTEIPKLHIIIDDSEGGTGASSSESINHSGGMALPLELQIHRLLEEYDILTGQTRGDFVTVAHYGSVLTPESLERALVITGGAGLGTGTFILQGCIKANICQTGKCPVGIASTDPGYTDRLAHKANNEGLTHNKLLSHLQIAKMTVKDLQKLYVETHGRELTDLSQIYGDLELLETTASTGIHGVKAPFDFSDYIADIKRAQAARLEREAETAAKADVAETVSLASVPRRVDTEHAVDPDTLSDMDVQVEGPQLSEVDLPRYLIGRSAADLGTQSGYTYDLKVIKALESGNLEQAFDANTSKAGSLAYISTHLYRNPLPEDQRLKIDVKGSLTGNRTGNLLSGPIDLLVDNVGDIAFALQGEGSCVVVRKSAGNVVCNGATGGIFVAARGEGHPIRMGERFYTRGSGGRKTVEETGDFACKFCGEGSVLIYGNQTGRNLASGSTGGKIFVKRDIFEGPDQTHSTLGKHPTVKTPSGGDVPQTLYDIEAEADISLLILHFQDLADIGDAEAAEIVTMLSSADTREDALKDYVMIDPVRQTSESSGASSQPNTRGPSRASVLPPDIEDLFPDPTRKSPSKGTSAGNRASRSVSSSKTGAGVTKDLAAAAADV